MRKTARLAILIFVFVAATAQVWIRQDRADFSCQMVSTATILTQITGCVGLAAATAAAPSTKNLYIKTIVWSMSAVSTTTNFLAIKYGTQTSTVCDTGTAVVFNDFSTAFLGRSSNFDPPIKIPKGNQICFLHGATGTKNLNITGYLE